MPQNVLQITDSNAIFTADLLFNPIGQSCVDQNHEAAEQSFSSFVPIWISKATESQTDKSFQSSWILYIYQR